MLRELRDVSNADAVVHAPEAAGDFVSTDVEGVSVRAELLPSDES
jgi:hypothetical protein